MTKTFSIGEAAKFLNLPTSTIRYWDSIGLLTNSRNEANDYRTFTYDDLFALYDVKFIRSLGLSIKDVQGIYRKSEKKVYEVLEQTEKRLAEEIEKLKAEMTQIKQRKRHLSSTGFDLTGTHDLKIDFTKMVRADLDENFTARKYLEKNCNSGIIWQEKNQSLEYAFCIDTTFEGEIEEEILWEYNPAFDYQPVIIEIDPTDNNRNNLQEVITSLTAKGYEIQQVIGEFLVRKQYEQTSDKEYYLSWIEIKNKEKQNKQ
ncbi:MerR family transcriptional regulator [Candidatus Enterococcus courvalinii]|uniref:MerR family transcriptional regulator n=1 Tax=Candidatus Enterococcus courvalinii TaxID=2815329 RepID=A0ABS3HX58_9ENTE|nr:MerR family transcriptional regulator [Enterococcus sp. MSG2901]MBO0481057.1 MerR family transcriptional regulator [Enterococcus sp. MSG2901]